MPVRVGARKSLLAMAQAEIVSRQLRLVVPDIEIEIVKIDTTGDKLYNSNLALIGGKGLFLKEIEEELLIGNIDIAVHSMKDVPVSIHEGLVIDCILKRDDVRDVFISKEYRSISELPKNSVIGTSSSRRKYQLADIRNDLTIVPFRGNINTRIEKIDRGIVDGGILALAGLQRISLEKHIREILSPNVMIPAVGQGAICIERRVGDTEIADLLSKIHDNASWTLIRVERAFMRRLEGDCTTPIAAHAIFIDNNTVSMLAGYFDAKQNKFLRVNSLGDTKDPESVGYLAAEKIYELI
jgi:hydroxymethylbilane synthase